MNLRSQMAAKILAHAALWAAVALAPGRLAGAEGVDLAALRRDTEEIATHAERARATLGSGADLDAHVATLWQLLKQIEDADYTYRMAAGKTERLQRDFDAKNRELERVKQHYAGREREIEARRAQVNAVGADLDRRYPEKTLPEPRYSAWKREADPLNARIRQLNTDSSQLHAEKQRAWDHAFKQLAAVQRELHDAAQQRDRAGQAIQGLLRQRATPLAAVARGLEPAAKLAAAPRPAVNMSPRTGAPPPPAAPRRENPAPAVAVTPPAAPRQDANPTVPLTPFQSAPANRPKFDGPDAALPRDPATAREQATGARTAGLEAAAAAAANAPERAKYYGGMRFDSREGPRGEPGNDAAPVSVGAGSAIPVWARPPTMPAAVAAHPAVARIVAARRETEQHLEKLYVERRAIAAKPDDYPPEAMRKVINEINREESQRVQLRVIEHAVATGSKDPEMISLQFDFGPETPAVDAAEGRASSEPSEPASTTSSSKSSSSAP